MTGFHVAVLTAIIYVQIATAFNDTEHQALKVQINDAKHAKEFSSLLNSIVNVNKERYDTLKRMARLQQFPPYPPRQALRAGESEDSVEDEDEDDESGPEIVAYLVLPAEASNLRASPNSEDDETENDSKEKQTEKTSQLSHKDGRIIKSNKDSSDSSLLDSLRSCNSKVVKKCKTACKRAKNEACSVYTCKRKMKKRFDKECKKACRYEFKRRGGSSSWYKSDDDW